MTHRHCFVVNDGGAYCDCGAGPPPEFWEREWNCECPRCGAFVPEKHIEAHKMTCPDNRTSNHDLTARALRNQASLLEYKAPHIRDQMLWAAAELERLQAIAEERDELVLEVARLQHALAFWLPKVPASDHQIATRIGDDALLLFGCECPLEPCAEEQGIITLRLPDTSGESHG